MDDYIQNHGADQFKREILGKALAPEEWVKIVSKLETDLASDQKPAKSRYMQRKNAIRALWGHRLRLNTLKQQVELDGEPLDIDFVRADLCEALDIDIPKEEAIEMVLTLAGVNRYCPITEYLRHVEQTYSDPNINLDTLASQLLNTSNPLHAVYLKRHLIGSVARALHPGCKMDTALILQGNQGILKSTFFNILYGDGFFDDTMTETGDKDEIMKLHQHWAVEWAEFETTLSRRGYSRLKAFMTTKVDNFRPPYGRTVKSCLRHSVLVGSTNEPEFLNDPSGDRRFWVIPIKQINIELTKSLRDQIWAAAVQAYKKGEPWHLNEQEKQWADEANRPFRVSDTWEDFISNYIQGKQFVTIAEVLSHGLDLEPAKQDKSSQMRATAILRRWGWAKGKRWAMNSWIRGWFAPDDRSTDPPFLEVDRLVDRSEKPNEIKVSSYTDPPDPPFPPTLSEITTSTQHQLTPTPGEGENDVKENSGKSWEKGGSVMEVDRSESDVKSRVTTTDPPVDYSSYPHLTSDTIEAKRNQAERIKLRLLEATTRDQLSALQQEFSTRLEWTQKHLLTDAERNKITAVAQTLQLNLLTPGADVPAQVAQSPTNSAEEVAQLDENEQLIGWNQCHKATAYVCPTDASVEECQKRTLC
jgi:predicted P-loop ATPase